MSENARKTRASILQDATRFLGFCLGASASLSAACALLHLIAVIKATGSYEPLPVVPNVIFVLSHRCPLPDTKTWLQTSALLDARRRDRSDGDPTAADPTGMIRAKDLHALLKQHVDDQGGSGGAMLTTGKGATLSAAGFDGVEAPRSVSAIRGARLGALWPCCRRGRTRATSRTLVFCVEGGHLALGRASGKGARSCRALRHRRRCAVPSSRAARDAPDKRSPTALARRPLSPRSRRRPTRRRRARRTALGPEGDAAVRLFFLYIYSWQGRRLQVMSYVPFVGPSLTFINPIDDNK